MLYHRTVIGSLGVGFKFNTIINQVISSYIKQQMYIEIYNQKTKKLVYTSDKPTNEFKDNSTLSTTIRFAEVPWEIKGYNKNNYLQQGYLLMFTLIGISTVLSLYIIYLYLERKSQQMKAHIIKQTANHELEVAKNKILEEEIRVKEQFLKDRVYFFAQIMLPIAPPLIGFYLLIK